MLISATETSSLLLVNFCHHLYQMFLRRNITKGEFCCAVFESSLSSFFAGLASYFSFTDCADVLNGYIPTKYDKHFLIHLERMVFTTGSVQLGKILFSGQFQKIFLDSTGDNEKADLIVKALCILEVPLPHDGSLNAITHDDILGCYRKKALSFHYQALSKVAGRKKETEHRKQAARWIEMSKDLLILLYEKPNTVSRSTKRLIERNWKKSEEIFDFTENTDDMQVFFNLLRISGEVEDPGEVKMTNRKRKHDQLEKVGLESKKDVRKF